MSISKLKAAIKQAEKARNEWNGIGQIPVSYDELCKLRAQLTNALVEARDKASSKQRAEEADKKFWESIWSRIDVQ